MSDEQSEAGPEVVPLRAVAPVVDDRPRMPRMLSRMKDRVMVGVVKGSEGMMVNNKSLIDFNDFMRIMDHALRDIRGVPTDGDYMTILVRQKQIADTALEKVDKILEIGGFV